MTPDKIRLASQLVGKESLAAIARLLGLNRATLYAHVPELQGRHRTALPSSKAHRNALFLTRAHTRLLRTGLAELHGPPTPSKLRGAARAYETAITDLTRTAGLAA
jgi:dsRNA-specific ribonuclease